MQLTNVASDVATWKHMVLICDLWEIMHVASMMKTIDYAAKAM